MLKGLIDHFKGETNLPIEVGEIANKIIEMGYQDEIHLFPVDCDPTMVRGVYTQFRYSGAPYSDARWVTHIAYCQNVTLEWQRVICAKELVHIFDPTVAKTDTEEEVSALLDQLVGPLSTEAYGLADLMAAKDRLALYQCLPILLPNASLDIAREEVRAGRKSEQDVANWAAIPLQFIQLMLRNV